MNKQIVLASQSPRRIELLRKIGLDIIVQPSSFDESTIDHSDPIEFVLTAARSKGLDVAKSLNHKYPKGIFISADTVVYQNHTIFGKPKNKEDAFNILTQLSNSWHQVATGVCIHEGVEEVSAFVATTEVKFKPFTSESIWEYIKTGEPMDKAGAYGIQGEGKKLIESIDGDFLNVMGLPVSKLIQNLEDKNMIKQKDYDLKLLNDY